MKKIYYALKRFFRKEIPVTPFDEQVVHHLVADREAWSIDILEKGPAVVFRARHRELSLLVVASGIPSRLDYYATVGQRGGDYEAPINETLAENLWWTLYSRHKAQQGQFRQEWIDKVARQMDALDSNQVSANTE